MNDVELSSMAGMMEALAPLAGDRSAVERVIRWTAARCGVVLASAAQERIATSSPREEEKQETETFKDFAEFFERASPKTHSECALIGGYWFQEIKGQSDWASRIVNVELNGLGRGLSNVTASLTDLMEKKPKLVIQTGKGSSQYAHKKYRITSEGIKKVKRMISGSLTASD